MVDITIFYNKENQYCLKTDFYLSIQYPTNIDFNFFKNTTFLSDYLEYLEKIKQYE